MEVLDSLPQVLPHLPLRGAVSKVACPQQAAILPHHPTSTIWVALLEGAFKPRKKNGFINMLG